MATTHATMATKTEQKTVTGDPARAAKGGRDFHQAFAADMASLHSSSLYTRRVAFRNSLPVNPATKSSAKSALSTEVGITVASQVGYTLLTYAGFLATTWTRIILVLPNILSQPLDLLSMVLFASIASVFLAGALVASLFSLLPVIGPLIQELADYFMVGPYGQEGVTSALYYKKFPDQLKDSAQKVLASAADTEFEPSDGSEKPRTIDLDAARYLSALCALVYLRDSKKYAQSLIGEVEDTGNCPVYDSAIRDIARVDLQLQYVPLCELPSRHASPRRPSTASVGLFYSISNPTFIILAFKGTTPTSFPDWLVDFTFPYLPANAELDAYGSVHEGFYRALFPRDVRAWAEVEAEGPWDLMRMGIRKTVSLLDSLQPEGGKRDINVWITGHSLGAVLAQMFFAKALQTEDDWKVEVGETKGGSSDANQDKKARYAKAVMRDSYTFGTPIFGDVFSRGSFNNALFAPKKGRRHDVWRFVNHDDIVATGLPALGDESYKQGWLPAAISTTSDTGGLGGLNEFTFTHVGQEVTLKNGSGSFVGPGTLWPWGTNIVIKGGTGNANPNAIRPYLSSVPWWLVALQQVPLFGRVLAHSPILYAYQLEQCTASVAGGDGQVMAWAT